MNYFHQNDKIDISRGEISRTIFYRIPASGVNKTAYQRNDQYNGNYRKRGEWCYTFTGKHHHLW